MNESRRKSDVEAVRRRQKGLRIKKGLVAGYLHELSDRHNNVAAPRVQTAGEALAEPSRSA
jgi:hypothetical protein